jgi:hypothetical protein
MSKLGYFTGYDIRGSDVLFCACNWVGLALDQDNAMRVTILHGVHPANASFEDAGAIARCGDMYDFSCVKTDSNGYEATFELPDCRITFRCDAISYGTRYYTSEEIDLIFKNFELNPNASDELRAKHHNAVEARKQLIVTDRFQISVALVE